MYIYVVSTVLISLCAKHLWLPSNETTQMRYSIGLRVFAEISRQRMRKETVVRRILCFGTYNHAYVCDYRRGSDW
jgi:hypothetical protein